jgi:outer membrane protein, multidrug efflux system
LTPRAAAVKLGGPVRPDPHPTASRAALRRAGIAALALVAGACRAGRDYEPPDLSARTDPAWREPSGAEVTAEKTDLARWWRHLGSDELDALAERLLAQSLTLAEARQRVEAAQARRAVAGAGRRLTVEGQAAYLRAGTGDESLNFAGPPPGTDVDLYGVGASAAWEMDLWGRVGRAVEAAEADVDVALEDARAAAVSLLAELALAYVDACTLREELDLARRDAGLAESLLSLEASRLEAGSGTRLAVERGRRAAEAARARVPEEERALRAAENRIAVLIGERPADGLVAAADPLELPPAIGLGLPADLIARRADVRRAERELARSVALVGEAQAERYPSISLSGMLSLRAMDVGTLADGADALSYSIGPSLTIPLLEGGRIEGTVRLREARAEEARLALERTLLEAVGEVETAAEGVVRTRQRLERLDDAAAAAHRAADLADELHAAGTEDLRRVYEARRTEVATALDRAGARRAALVETVDLYRALGGGWEAAGPAAAGASSEARAETP